MLAPHFLAEVSEVNAAEAAENTENIRTLYEEYNARFAAVEYKADITENGFEIVDIHIFPVQYDIDKQKEMETELVRQMKAEPDADVKDLKMNMEAPLLMIPAYDKTYNRLALFFVDEDDRIMYKTDRFETNSCVLGQVQQPAQELVSVAFQDLNGDMLTDIILITSCEVGDGRKYRIGDVLFQDTEALIFYRDYRISDKINRFAMNQNTDSITAFVRDGYSTEFLYTAVTLKELQQHNFQIITEQCYTRTFGKLGKLQVVPGTYRIADYDVFMIYLVNEQDYILSVLQPMGDYDNLYALKGINCRDIDGDGLKDIVVLAKYSYEDEEHRLAVASDYSIYYQRTGGFSADTEIKKQYQCSEEDTMQSVVEKARAYWGWKTEDDTDIDR
ncbi:MAG: VCBS repeat-containing protein [Lachnospiraceae bacterium]|nr:VCBS repeat-containing protein [Lachnospiraceae bacterium]